MCYSWLPGVILRVRILIWAVVIVVLILGNHTRFNAWFTIPLLFWMSVYVNLDLSKIFFFFFLVYLKSKSVFSISAFVMQIFMKQLTSVMYDIMYKCARETNLTISYNYVSWRKLLFIKRLAICHSKGCGKRCKFEQICLDLILVCKIQFYKGTFL